MSQMPKPFKNIVLMGVVIACLAGIFLRFYAITEENFFFFDEGYYFNLHREYIELIEKRPPQNFTDFKGAFYMCVRLALGEGKALWFLLSHVRAFWGHLEDWWYGRMLSAIFGTIALFVFYLFVRRFANSKQLALLSVTILAVLPGHVFYSRLGLQESLCTLMFFLRFTYIFFRPSLAQGLLFPLFLWS